MGTSKKYVFTKQDSVLISKMGYVFHGIDAAGFALFMQQNFPGFNLALLLQQVEGIITAMIDPSVTRKITVNEKAFQVELENDHKGIEDKALIFDRVFYNRGNNISIYHQYLIIPKTFRDKGHSKRILKASLNQYLLMGAKEVLVQAGLSAGAYVWARNGFVATKKSDMEVILARAKSMLLPRQFDMVKRIFDHYYYKYPKGMAFPIKRWANLPFMKAVLTGGQIVWDGRLDLKNPVQLRKFDNYVSQ